MLEKHAYKRKFHFEGDTFFPLYSPNKLGNLANFCLLRPPLGWIDETKQWLLELFMIASNQSCDMIPWHVRAIYGHYIDHLLTQRKKKIRKENSWDHTDGLQILIKITTSTKQKKNKTWYTITHKNCLAKIFSLFLSRGYRSSFEYDTRTVSYAA